MRVQTVGNPVVQDVSVSCDNIYTTVTQTLTTEVPAAAVLNFQGDMEQSLLIGEGVEIKEESEKEVTLIQSTAVKPKIMKLMTILYM